MPETIISDRGSQFNSGFMKELCRLLGIKQNISTAFHPQTDGQMERTNQEIEQYLRTYINWHQDDWQEWVPIMEFAYNDRKHTAMGYTPFYIKYGRHPYKGIKNRKKQTVRGINAEVRTPKSERTS
jgi:transposase InsO family protein